MRFLSTRNTVRPVNRSEIEGAMSEDEKDKPEPEELEDSALDQISGGLGLVSTGDTSTARPISSWPCKWDNAGIKQ
jgi:hypothetical protein